MPVPRTGGVRGTFGDWHKKSAPQGGASDSGSDEGYLLLSHLKCEGELRLSTYVASIIVMPLQPHSIQVHRPRHRLTP